MSEDASFFGSLDLDSIPEGIPTGTYECEVTEFPVVHNEKKDTHSRILKYQITDTSSEYEGEEIQEWIPIFPNLTQVEYDGMDADSKKKVRDSVNKFKTRMRELGLSDLEINDPEKVVDKVVGKKVAVSVRTNGKYVNVRYVNLMDSVDESEGSGFSGFQ